VATELSAVLEDYLGTVFRIEQQKGFARVRDVAAALSVANSTATAAFQSLHERGLINYRPYEPVTLSPKGRQESERIALRHRIIEDFLHDVLDIVPERAESIACGMAHDIDGEALGRFVCFLAFVRQERAKGEDWLEEFRGFMAEGAGGRSCTACIEAYMKELKGQ